MGSEIELQNITKIYGTKIQTTVLQGIDLKINPGEYMAIIGESGSGKSTLLNIISTLDRPSGGEIFIDGNNVNQLSDNKLASFRSKTLGFIFQFHHLFPEFNALENVLIPHWLAYGKPDNETKALAKELLQRVYISEHIYRKITDLSGGQQQRVAIARALINRPQIILADEPTGSLDSKTTMEINKLMREINEEFDTTFVMVTHERHIAAECDRVIELLDGGISRDYYTKDVEMEEKWKEIGPDHCFRIQEMGRHCEENCEGTHS